MSFVGKIKGKIHAESWKLCKTVFDFIQRKRLKNRNFSIISSNCIGGIIYHRLGMQFLSPTINLWFPERDFIKFVLDLEGYLAEELVFVESKYSHPVAQLRDIKVYFSHYHTKDEARNAWNQRKARINFDNLYIVMYDRDGVTREDLLKLKDVPCKGRIVLSEHVRNYEGVDYIQTLIPGTGAFGNQFIDADEMGIYTFEKQFDYVSWLNNSSD